ncbi:MAG: HAMP domain-containing sensor histidine kinase [Calditrichaceae bacterium]
MILKLRCADILKNITNQKQILKYEKVDINEVVLSIIEDLHFDIQDKNIEINIKTKLPPIYSNRIILKHVFQNLLDNACKYFPKQGNNKIDILYSDNNSNYVFSIKDTGPGMSKELQKKLFNPSDFNQAVNTVEDVDSGLGLELVRTFIEIINGKIWLESEVGEGSTFFISLNKLDDTKAGIFE